METMKEIKIATGMCRYFNHKWQDKVFDCDGFPTYRECTRKNCNHAQSFWPLTGWNDVDKRKERRCNHG